MVNNVLKLALFQRVGGAVAASIGLWAFWFMVRGCPAKTVP
jgi:hypothetical protein